MNKLIEELAEKAGFNLIRENCYDIVSTTSVKEFAELIVRECAKVIDNSPGSLDDYSMVYLSKHFGIEVTTMDERYGDVLAEHEVCDKCGFCKECGDCETFGCGKRRRNAEKAGLPTPPLDIPKKPA